MKGKIIEVYKNKLYLDIPLNEGRFKSDRTKCFFTNYIIKVWNLLPAVVMGVNLDGFKKGQDRFMKDQTIND